LRWTRHDTAPVVFGTLFVVLLTPPVMAVVAAAAISKSDAYARDSYGVTPFMATRPSTSAALVAAKLKMTIWSALAAWLVVLVSIPVALMLSGTLPVVIERARAGTFVVGAPRAIAIVLLGSAALLASTWKNRAEPVHRPDRLRVDHQIDGVARPDVHRRRRDARRLDREAQERTVCDMERVPLDPRRSRLLQAVAPHAGSRCASMTDGC
jgi:hypothetical protein